MAVLLDKYMPYDSGAGSNVTESDWRAAFRFGMPDRSGVIRAVNNDLQVYADSTGMQSKVKTGELWAESQWGANLTEKILPIAAAHATLARIDLVVIRNDFGGNKMEIDVITGTPAASPVAPAPTRNSAMYEVRLAEVAVAAAAVTIAAGNVTDRREYSKPYVEGRRITTQTIVNNAATRVKYDSFRVTSPGDIQVTSQENFKFNQAGVYMVCAGIEYGLGDTDEVGLRIYDVDNDVFIAELNTDPGAAPAKSSISRAIRVPAGRTLSIVTFQVSAGAVSRNLLGTENTYVCIFWYDRSV